MLEHLSARHQSRKPDPSDSPTTSAFLSRFNVSKKSITTQVESSADPSRLPDISTAISDLEKFVAENSYLLPSYEIRSSLKTISDLKTDSRESDLSTDTQGDPPSLPSELDNEMLALAAMQVQVSKFGWLQCNIQNVPSFSRVYRNLHYVIRILLS